MANDRARPTDVTVRVLTRDQMLTERAELLAASGMTEAALRAAGTAWELRSELRGILSRINGLDWLLSHTRSEEAAEDV